MRSAVLVLVAAAAWADSTAPASSQPRLFESEPLCWAPQRGELKGVSEREYERQALLAFRRKKVFPLWKAAFAFRRTRKGAPAIEVRDGDQPRWAVSSWQEPVGLPSQCSQGCCTMMREDAPRWVSRLCFDAADRVDYVEIAHRPISADYESVPELDVAAVTLPPKTAADEGLRKELLADPPRALERLERLAREQPRGRWQRDACLPLSLAELGDTPRTDALLFCLLYMPDALPRRDALRAELRRALPNLLAIEHGVDSAARARRLALAISDDPAVRTLYQRGAAALERISEGRLPRSTRELRWWGGFGLGPQQVSSEKFRHHLFGINLDGCEGACCEYHHEGGLPCTVAGAGDGEVITRVCFARDGQPEEVWSYPNTDGEPCVPDER